MFMLVGMLLPHIERTDLNLIPALVALLEERHVSRAATRVGLSQPAMSRALHRLRRVFNDQLLIRDPNGYRLTARAELIYAQLSTVVPQLETLLAADDFEPSTATRPINVAGTDYAVHTYGPAISRALIAQSPSAPIRFHAWRHEGVAEQIRRGTVDLGLYGGYVDDDLRAAELLEEEFVCVVAAGHPAAAERALTLDEYVRFRHLVIDVEDGRQPDIDYRLDDLGKCREPGLTVPYHAVVPQLLPGTELIATLPRGLTHTWSPSGGLVVMGAPPEIAALPYRMIWHPAFDNDRRHRWLRETVGAAVASQVRQ
jgi:DNA-binding transcriptional LysR family regulator